MENTILNHYGSAVVVLGAGAVLLAFLFQTLSPSIAGGDSGELVAEGCMLGTAHPPGYPLFTMIVFGIKKLLDYTTELFGQFDAETKTTYIAALGSVAYSINAFSALLTVGAATCIGLIISSSTPTNSNDKIGEQSWTHHVGGSLFGMGMFTFSPLIWQYAVTAEVFPLNTFFASLILLLVLQFAKRGTFAIALLGAFVCGLALCNQHTIVLYEAPLILYMMFLLRRRIIDKPVNTCLMLGFAFLAGLAPYLYLPIAAIIDPKHGSWGHVSTLEGFVHHFLRRDYGTFKLFSGEQGRNAEGFQVRCWAYMKDIIFEQGLFIAPVLAVLAIVSWHRVVAQSSESPSSSSVTARVAAGKDQKKHFDIQQLDQQKKKKKSPALFGDCKVSPEEANWTPIAFLVTQLFYFGIFHSLANLPLSNKLLYGIHQRFWMQPNVLLFIWAGIGYNALFNLFSLVPVQALLRLFGSKKKASSPAQQPIGYAAIVQTVSVVGAMALVSAQYLKWHPISNQTGAYYWKNYASAILEGLPQNSVLLINYDMQWTSVRYLQKCEKFRDDVIAINLSMMTYTWFHNKRVLYPTITWPGTYLAPPNVPIHRQNRAFTLKEFLDANTESIPIYLGGKVSHADPELEKGYNFIPAGLVSKIVPVDRSPNGTTFNRWNQMNWISVTKNMERLPDMKKYPEETWEWTINRDFRDRVSGT